MKHRQLARIQIIILLLGQELYWLQDGEGLWKQATWNAERETWYGSQYTKKLWWKDLVLDVGVVDCVTSIVWPLLYDLYCVTSIVRPLLLCKSCLGKDILYQNFWKCLDLKKFYSFVYQNALILFFFNTKKSLLNSQQTPINSMCYFVVKIG